MKSNQIIKDLSMICRNAVDYINNLELKIASMERQPLTEKEIYEVWDKVYEFLPGETKLLDFARGIEQAHGIGELE